MTERMSDHTYLKTDDNIYFCVAGNLHSKEVIYGQPYYFLRKELSNILDIQINEFVTIQGQEFSKLVDNIKPHQYSNFIKDNYPAYYYSPPMWEVLMRVERSKVSEVLDPRTLVRKFRSQ